MKQRFSKRTRLVSALLTLAMVFTFLPFSAFAATDIYGPVYISNLIFPDETFLNYVKRFDTDNNSTLSPTERYAVTEIDVSGKKITSLKGIEFFPNLTKLICRDNELTELDVSKNKELKHLYCDDNQLTSLQLDDCTKLGTYSCNDNEYSVQVYESTRILDPGTLPGNFDISRVRNMKGATKNADGTMTVNPGEGKVLYEYRLFRDYYDYYFVIFTLNVTWTNDATPSDGIALNAKNFPDEAFRTYVQTYFDTDGNGYLQNAERKAVTGMFADKKNLTNLKGVEHFPNLKKLYCYDNQVSSLDVSKNTALEELICYNNQLTSLDVSNNTALKKLQCYNNQLSSLDVSNNTELKELLCYQNQLTSLDVSNNTALEKLNCCQNSLTSLDVSKNTALKDLTCQKNNLTSLDVTQNTGLEYLSCGSHPLGSLDVSKNINLKTLYCEQSNLTSLDLSQNHKLEMLYAKENRLTSLDLSQTAVTALYTGDNQIDINVKTTSRTFDLSILPGFDVTKVRKWVGGTVSGNTLTVDEGVNQVTYTYDCGKGLSRNFTLNVNVVPDGTVTPPEPPVTPPEPPVTPPTGGDGGGAVVIVAAAGAVAAGVVGYGVYNYVSGRKLQALLPEGVAAPENRAQTALLLWNTAGRPEPAEAPAFADVADPDTAKAAQWCVEQGLMKRRLNGKFAPGSSIPAYQVLNAYRKLAG